VEFPQSVYIYYFWNFIH